jgi:hypothetical protein
MLQLIEVEGDRRDQVYDTGLSKRLQMCLFMLPKNVPTTKRNVPARPFWCESVDYIP